jgi:D-alanyl-D-alanine carboxypeptidase
MVMDARTGEVLHSRNADTRLHPASLTKMMTLYIAFEAVRLGEITLDTPVEISQAAASEPPSRLGLRAGTTIRFRYLIRAAAVRSANDAATAIAEAISGSEADFARRMNRTALALGLTRTTFRNAHGLTEDGHLSTARDMTILGRRLFYDYPQYYNIFSRQTADAGIATVRNTNRALLNAYRGADGIKTGYTRAAGFNLVASAERDDVRVLATVFGGRSAAWRNQRIMELFDMGFDLAPRAAAVRRPSLPVYEGLPASRVVRPSGAVTRSLRPLPRPSQQTPVPEIQPDLLAAIEDAVGAALEGEGDVAEVAPSVPPSRTPMPRPEPHTALVVPPRAVTLPQVPDPEPELVTRASSSGSRLFGVSLGHQPTQRDAERLLLQTALRELATFQDTLRHVVRENGAFDARFHGMTEVEATRACARLAAQGFACDLVGPT